MTNFSNAEAMSFNEDLALYQRREIEADKFHEAVNALIEYKICTLEYDPYTPEHMAEAMDEMGDRSTYNMLDIFESFVKYGEAIHLITYIRNVSKNYWEQIARHDAVNEVIESSK